MVNSPRQVVVIRSSFADLTSRKRARWSFSSHDCHRPSGREQPQARSGRQRPPHDRHRRARARRRHRRRARATRAPRRDARVVHRDDDRHVRTEPRLGHRRNSRPRGLRRRQRSAVASRSTCTFPATSRPTQRNGSSASPRPARCVAQWKPVSPSTSGQSPRGHRALSRSPRRTGTFQEDDPRVTTQSFPRLEPRACPTGDRITSARGDCVSARASGLRRDGRARRASPQRLRAPGPRRPRLPRLHRRRAVRRLASGRAHAAAARERVRKPALRQPHLGVEHRAAGERSCARARVLQSLP